jgi:hypothetical protein
MSKICVKSTRGLFITSTRPCASNSRSTYVFIAKLSSDADGCAGAPAPDRIVVVTPRPPRARSRRRRPAVVVAVAPRVAYIRSRVALSRADLDDDNHVDRNPNATTSTDRRTDTPSIARAVGAKGGEGYWSWS